MKCWSCGKRIPDGAQACKHCEAPVETEPTHEEAAAVLELLGRMNPAALDEMRAIFAQSKDGEDFANQILVGPVIRIEYGLSSWYAYDFPVPRGPSSTKL